jgi:hypothetical protein
MLHLTARLVPGGQERQCPSEVSADVVPLFIEDLEKVIAQ